MGRASGASLADRHDCPAKPAETCGVRRPAAGGGRGGAGQMGTGGCTSVLSRSPPSRALDRLSPLALQENVAAAETSAKRGAGAGRGRRAERGSLTGLGEQLQQERRERPAPQPPHGSLIILRVRGLRLRAARRRAGRGGGGRRGCGSRGGGGARAGGGGVGSRLSALRPRPSRRGGGPG